MAWIKAGTVAISNGGTTVTGTGTSWLTGVNVGDAFVAPDGRLYEITGINSATSLVIAPAYQGSGVSGSDYIIAPTRSLTGTLAERVQSLISDFSDVKDNAGASKMGDFIRYLSDQDTGLQRVGSNTQVLVCGGVDSLRLTATEASGEVVQSSSSDHAAGKLMLAAYGYGRSNIIATVSQSGGVPTGAIIERGSNANGEYTKYADGTLECWHTLSPGSSVALGDGSRSSPYRTSDFGWTFPSAFSATPSVTATARADDNGAIRLHFVSLRSVTATSIAQANVVRFSDVSTALSPTVHAVAHGRWF